MVPELASARDEHWEQIYATRSPEAVGWYEAEPTLSRQLIDTFGNGPDAAVVDVGGGASFLVDRLLDDGYRDLTLLDVSDHALDQVRARLGERASRVTFVHGDVVAWAPERRFDVWHDRAAFHFLCDPADRARYVAVASAVVRVGGVVVLGVFAPDGPASCSGMPVCRYDADDLAVLFRHSFELVHDEHAAHVTPSGAEQPYTWVVLRRV